MGNPNFPNFPRYFTIGPIDPVWQVYCQIRIHGKEQLEGDTNATHASRILRSWNSAPSPMRCTRAGVSAATAMRRGRTAST